MLCIVHIMQANAENVFTSIISIYELTQIDWHRETLIYANCLGSSWPLILILRLFTVCIFVDDKRLWYGQYRLPLFRGGWHHLQRFVRLSFLHQNWFAPNATVLWYAVYTAIQKAFIWYFLEGYKLRERMPLSYNNFCPISSLLYCNKYV